MDARHRVRQFLAGEAADRPPFLAMATQYSAKLAQCTAEELLADPGLFVRSFQESVAVLGLEALLIEIPAACAAPVAAGGDPAASGCGVLREDLHRLRATLRNQVAIVTALPGPLMLCAAAGQAATPDLLDDQMAGLIRLQEYLGPAELDALALLERVQVAGADVPGLADAATGLWNVARYYSLPSLLIAAAGPASLAAAGSTAVAAWSGTTAAALLAAGARAAGQPPADLMSPPTSIAGPTGLAPAPAGELPAGGFYLTPGEIPPGWDVSEVRAMVLRLLA